MCDTPSAHTSSPALSPATFRPPLFASLFGFLSVQERPHVIDYFSPLVPSPRLAIAASRSADRHFSHLTWPATRASYTAAQGPSDSARASFQTELDAERCRCPNCGPRTLITAPFCCHPATHHKEPSRSSKFNFLLSSPSTHYLLLCYSRRASLLAPHRSSLPPLCLPPRAPAISIPLARNVMSSQGILSLRCAPQRPWPSLHPLTAHSSFPQRFAFMYTLRHRSRPIHSQYPCSTAQTTRTESKPRTHSSPACSLRIALMQHHSHRSWALGSLAHSCSTINGPVNATNQLHILSVTRLALVSGRTGRTLRHICKLNLALRSVA